MLKMQDVMQTRHFPRPPFPGNRADVMETTHSKPVYQSSRLAALEVSEILRIGARARSLKRAGQDIIILGAGEPDFDTPDFVKDAACKAIRDGQTKYTALEGTVELRAAIAEKLARENGLSYSPDEIIVSCGAKQVIFNALAATLEPGDEVVLPTPFWTSYADMVALNDGVPKLVSCGAEKRFKLDPEALERALSPRTRWIFLNSPSNPAGTGYSRAELSALLAVIERRPSVLVLSDEIYEHIVYDGFTHVSPVAAAPGLRERIIIVNGVSKAYAMTGWRIGWGAGPRELVAAMAVVQSQITSCASSVGQAAAVAALAGPQNEVRVRARAFQARRDMLVRELNAIPGISCDVPDGAFYVFPALQGLLGRVTPAGRTLADDRDVTDFFLEQAGVAVVPGSAFALPGHFRISYAASLESLKESCARLRSAVQLLPVAVS